MVFWRTMAVPPPHVKIPPKRGFQPGNPGRPKGARSKKQREIEAFCRALFERPKYQRRIRAGWDAGTLDPGVERLLLQYGFGRVTQPVKVGAEDSLLALLRRLPVRSTSDAT